MQPDECRRTIHITSWETVAITPLPPGWRNVYRIAGDDSPHENPCPAILLQEDRGTTEAWDEPQGDGPMRRRSRFKAAEPPYETRAIFADWDHSCLCPADEASNYAGGDGPGQDASSLS